MELNTYVDKLRDQLAVAAAAGGDDARLLAERLIAPLDSAVRLMLLDVLAAAAAEITRELAPGSVELRLRGSEPEFVVAPALDAAVAGDRGDSPNAPGSWLGPDPASATARRGRSRADQLATPRSAQEPGGAGSRARRTVDQRVARAGRGGGGGPRAARPPS